MCLVLPARVVSVSGATAKILLHGEQQPVSASTELVPDLRPGDIVLVDRGMVLRVIEPDEAAAILAIYAEMEQLMEEAEADSVHA
jgi:hydrogenase assembly chaperone HypC/HupF